MSATTSRTRIRLKPADSFDLIRLLARSQHDARKAVCELVQNSLDAQANHVELTWFTDSGLRALRIWDDGEGIFPALEREEALRKIVHTIGHSHKRALTPVQRRELMLLGKYGIGLLGFWSVGQMMEIRSRVAGGPTWLLRLWEDNSHAELRRAPSRRLDESETHTSVTLRGIHEGAARQIRPARLHAYLAGELRGQLLRRAVRITIRDRVARGRAQKFFEVEPARFRGRRLTELQQLAVPGYEDALLELYLLPPEGDVPGRVALACEGTTIIDDLAEVDGVGLPRAPWDSGRLEGVVDFGELNVPPGTRRGFQRDAAALAFLDALRGLEDRLCQQIAEDDRRRHEEAQQNLARQIRRAFVAVATALPQYDLFDVRGRRAGDETAEPEDAATLGEGLEEARRPAPAAGNDNAPTGDGELFPPGPVAAVRITPGKCRLAPGSRKVLRAQARDADGRSARGPLEWSWVLGGSGDLKYEGDQASYTAPADPCEAAVEATAREGLHSATGRTAISVTEEMAGQNKVSGIPEPRPVHAPLEPWRSRMHGTSWEFNSGHRDYVIACESPSRRLRYLIHLFAKELVLRNFGSPADDAVLERMVEVLTHLATGRQPAKSP